MIDLHTHSSFSDGSLNPKELIEEAKRQKIKALAITDHDTSEGIRNLNTNSLPLNFVPGIEISVQYDDKYRFHILGLFINPKNSEVYSFELLQKSLREERNLEIAKKLNSFGYEIDYEEVKRKAGNIVGRMHFALMLVEKGYFNNVKDAIEKLLKPGKPAYVQRKRISYKEGIEKIYKMKGISIISHIGKELEDGEEIENIIKKFKDSGLDGVEVYHSDHTKKMTNLLKKISKKYSLVISGGTDFHGKNKEGVLLGKGRGNLNIPYNVYLNLLKYYEKKF